MIPVSLYGQCADFDELVRIASARKIRLIEDGAQSFGATYKGRRSCSLTEIAATSFFPSKPLGGYGDGGAVFTSDDGLAQRVRVLLNHGQTERYRHQFVGINGRLDTIQAAVLRVKLKHFDDECRARQKVADSYARTLGAVVVTPRVEPWNRSVWAQYTVRTPRRQALIDGLKKEGIPTAVHYPMPLHRQPVYTAMGLADPAFPVTSRVCEEVVSLPMHPFLTDAEIDRITSAIKAVK
jgi:UDP-2-acetamido-2-deoxy-ribo-hexuluronate aminotransferase